MANKNKDYIDFDKDENSILDNSIDSSNPLLDEFDSNDVINNYDKETKEKLSSGSNVNSGIESINENNTKTKHHIHDNHKKNINNNDELDDDFKIQYANEFEHNNELRKQKNFKLDFEKEAKNSNSETYLEDNFKDFLLVKKITGNQTGIPHGYYIPADFIKNFGSLEISQDIPFEEFSESKSTVFIHRNNYDEIESIEIICSCGEKTIIDFTDSDSENQNTKSNDNSKIQYQNDNYKHDINNITNNDTTNENNNIIIDTNTNDEMNNELINYNDFDYDSFDEDKNIIDINTETSENEAEINTSVDTTEADNQKSEDDSSYLFEELDNSDLSSSIENTGNSKPEPFFNISDFQDTIKEKNSKENYKIINPENNNKSKNSNQNDIDEIFNQLNL